MTEQNYFTFGSPCGAVRELELGANVSHINYCACGGMLCCINNKLEAYLHLIGNVFAADLILSKAKGTAFLGIFRAFAPADGTYTDGAVLALWIAEGSALLLVFVAGQRSASSAAVRILVTREADVCHTLGAVR